ncbi:hypothetical protein FGO68_gene7511 [Halteria grandinella]|uniref:Peptidase A1 domain-containing protein n=1 Tax=Halteria grandinella TaxID=5974 RepID=A0A8J8NH82_HALGN|nr:hypothetical protein FGO68_gene7511 [Halteria grandinella]
MCNYFTKLALLLLVLPHRTLQYCTTAQAPFPKVVGGVTESTYIYQVDYNQATEYLVGVGESYEQELRGDALGASTKPIVLAYTSEASSYAWGKVFGSFGVGSAFTGVKINRAGTRLVIATFSTLRYLIVMDITNGDVLSAT